MEKLSEKDGFIWVDGQLIDWREAKIHVLTHSLHYGMSVFEGVRAYELDNGDIAIFRLEDHTRRLFDSAKIFGMEIPFSQDEVNAAQKEVVKKNKLKDCYLRPICFYGSESLGLRADALSQHVAIAAWYWPDYLGEGASERGINVKTSSFTKNHVNILMCKAKSSGSYINSLLALKEVQSSGYDEALLLDNEGFVSEGSGQNIFIVRDQKVFTSRVNQLPQWNYER